jgi:hypothetical protein
MVFFSAFFLIGHEHLLLHGGDFGFVELAVFVGVVALDDGGIALGNGLGFGGGG